MQSLKRLISILEGVAANGTPTGAVNIARELQLPLSTVSRLMHQLADEGLLHRSASSGRYSIGPRLFALAQVGAAQPKLAEAAHPLLTTLRDLTGETSSLHVLRGSSRVCIAVVESQRPVRRVVPVGLIQPALGTATGDVLLAWASPVDRAEAIAAAKLRIPERRDLDRRLERIRSDGYALVVDDWVEGVSGLSAPVCVGAVIVAAVSVSGPSDRFTRQVALRHLTAVWDATSSLATQLGGFEFGDQGLRGETTLGRTASAQ